MTLSASDPWATVVAARAPGWTAVVEHEFPKLGPVTIATSGRTVMISAPGAADPWQAIQILAWEAAPWWPGWLHVADVICCIDVGSMTLTVDAEAMFDLGAMIGLF